MASIFPSHTTHFLYTVQPARLEMLTEGPTEEETALIAQHWAYLQKLHEEEVVIFVGRTLVTDESSFGATVLKADSEEHAYDIMEADPAVSSGLMNAQLYPFQVLLH
jgi:uncharacterized protein YciI